MMCKYLEARVCEWTVHMNDVVRLYNVCKTVPFGISVAGTEAVWSRPAPARDAGEASVAEGAITPKTVCVPYVKAAQRRRGGRLSGTATVRLERPPRPSPTRFSVSRISVEW